VAGKKVKLAFTPVDEASVPPETKVEHAGMTNCVYAVGRVVGRRQLPEGAGASELFFLDRNATEPRKLQLKPANFKTPAISLDGSRAMVAYGGPRPAVVEIDLDTGNMTTVWAQAAPMHDWWPPIEQPQYAVDGRVVFHTSVKQVLMKRSNDDTLEPVTALDGVEKCFASTSLFEGKFLLYNATASTFVVAVKNDSLYLLAKASLKKQAYSTRGGRLFALDAVTKVRSEALNLAAVWETL